MENHLYSKSLKLKPDKCVLSEGRVAPVVTHISSDIEISRFIVGRYGSWFSSCHKGPLESFCQEHWNREILYMLMEIN